MTAERRGGTRRPPSSVLGAGLAAAWAAAAALSPHVGFWVAMATAAVVLGALAQALDRLLRALFRLSAAALAAGLAAGIALAVGCWLFYGPIVSLASWAAADKAALDAQFAALSPAGRALLLPVAIAGEEIVWRGTVHDWLAARLGTVAGVLAGSVLYAATTGLSGSPLLAFMALVGGLLWSILRWTTGGLAAPIACHLTWAVLVLFVRPL